MCGIFGYIGEKQAAPILFNGLRRLEYRGYDSAGIAVLDNESIHVVKAKGKLSELEPLIPSLPDSAVIGIGHTRWATHGAPTVENAHPHVSEDGNIAIIHNGIIENHRALRAGLMEEGVTFSSETDSEIFAHLISRARKDGLSPLNSVKRATNQTRGT